jgi:hypothetical protein
MNEECIMGRAIQRKREQRRMQAEQAVFPFHLLTIWIRPYESLQPCRTCRGAASYAIEYYLDFLQRAGVVGNPAAKTQIEERLWTNLVTEQTAGKYTKALTAYHCEKCLYREVLPIVGENTGTFVTVMRALAPRLSILVGKKLSDAQDPGLPFTTLVDAQLTVDELARRLRALRNATELPSVI